MGRPWETSLVSAAAAARFAAANEAAMGSVARAIAMMTRSPAAIPLSTASSAFVNCMRTMLLPLPDVTWFDETTPSSVWI